MQPTAYEVVPHHGVGPVRLGMTRREARGVMREEPLEFFKSQNDAMPTDAFHESAFQVFYDRDGRVEYIELSASDQIEPVFDGQPVLALPADRVVETIARQTPFDDADPELGYTYVFPELDLALWRPILPEGDDDEGSTFSTVGIGRTGYFAGR